MSDGTRSHAEGGIGAGRVRGRGKACGEDGKPPVLRQCDIAFVGIRDERRGWERREVGALRSRPRTDAG